MARYIIPEWPVPGSVRTLVTTRCGGQSVGAYASFNLANHLGDEPVNVAQNRALLGSTMGTNTAVQWLQQVHGTRVIEVNEPRQTLEGDALVTRRQGVACAVLTADCLPILIASSDASAIGIAHAGWRGLANGIVENTVNAIGANPSELLVWLGPAISQRHFEVGADVLEAFVGQSEENRTAFQASHLRPDRWYADLYGLARIRLRALGVGQIFGGNYCTFEDIDQFYSYRRDGETGRMASIIWLEAN